MVFTYNKKTYKGKKMQESTALIKLTKSELEWTVIALVYSQQSAEHFEQWDDAKIYEKIRKDFVKIKNDIIKGEEENETKNKMEQKTQSNK
tara:strand:- start:374 stop:646 length:273 start_codon:yes stop_codon:yes gene_type:complete